MMAKNADLPTYDENPNLSELVNIKMGFFGRLAIKAGVISDDIMFWSWCESFENSGDWITPFIFFQKYRTVPRFAKCRHVKPPTNIIFGVGSILHHITVPDVAVVWGSGLISRDSEFARPKQILAVRGHYTRDRCKTLGFEVPEILGDPGILLPKFYRPREQGTNFKVGIIPHFVNYNEALRIYGKRPDITVIDITNPLPQVISQICQCEGTLSSSLHGIIISHAYGVSCSHVNFGDNLKGDGTKFADYFSSINEEFDRPPISLSKKIGGDELISLSQSNPPPNLEEMQEKLLQVIPF